MKRVGILVKQGMETNLIIFSGGSKGVSRTPYILRYVSLEDIGDLWPHTIPPMDFLDLPLISVPVLCHSR